MESDIIADTVANAFAQGVDRVFLADNGSPDDTVDRAQGAGAECVLTYRTDRFEERFRYNLMNELVRHISDTSQHDHIWWLWIDADEFPRPHGDQTLREFLAPLDERFRVVGARVLNHYPSPGEVAHEPGTHPVRHQPLCEEVPQRICLSMHRKHPLQRWDRSGPRIDAGLGFHRAECIERPLKEPDAPVVLHHIPYRNEEFTRRRLDALWNDDSSNSARAIRGDLATDHMEARKRSLDAVYSGAWENVHNFIPGTRERGVKLTDWREIAPSVQGKLPEWSLSQFETPSE